MTTRTDLSALEQTWEPRFAGETLQREIERETLHRMRLTKLRFAKGRRAAARKSHVACCTFTCWLPARLFAGDDEIKVPSREWTVARWLTSTYSRTVSATR